MADKESPVVDPKSTYNAAQSIMRYKDFAKLSKLNKGEVPLGVVARQVGTAGESVEHTGDFDSLPDNLTDQEKEHTKSMRNQVRPHHMKNTEIDSDTKTETGHGLQPSHQPPKEHIRRMKVNYKVEEETVNELKQSTVQSYKAKAEKEVGELEPWTKKGEYKDITKRMVARRKKGIDMAKQRQAVDEKIDINYMPDLGQQLERGKDEDDMTSKIKSQKVRTIPEAPMQPSGTDKVGFDNSVTRNIVSTHQAKTAEKSGKGKSSALLSKLRDRASVSEDVQSADYKVNAQGRKYRARHIEFSSSRQNADPARPEETPDAPPKPIKNEPSIIPGPETPRQKPKSFKQYEGSK